LILAVDTTPNWGKVPNPTTALSLCRSSPHIFLVEGCFGDVLLRSQILILRLCIGTLHSIALFGGRYV
jgi:hypothetical protein